MSEPHEISNDALLERDDAVVVRPWPKGNEPLPIVAAQGVYVTDADGRTFMDFTSGYFVNAVGHSHPKIIAAAKAQLDRVSQVSGRHATLPAIQLAEKLVDISPESISRVFFATGGSETVEFALKMVRQKSGKSDVVVLENAFHGLSLGALAACGNERYRNTAGVPLGDYVSRIPAPYCYRCPFKNNCATQCLDEAEVILDRRPETAAIVAEPVQSVGGVIPPEQWWSRLDDIRKARGLYLVLDEVQTGLGRTGAMYAAEHYGLQPDVMCSAKGLSGGVGSLGAVLCSDEMAEGFNSGTTPTSAGNAISAAAGLALIDVLIDDGVIAHAARMGKVFAAMLAEIDDPWIGDIRFIGLMGGIELVTDRESESPLPRSAVQDICTGLFKRNMLCTISGPHGNCLRLQPPLIIVEAQLREFVDALCETFADVRGTAAA